LQYLPEQRKHSTTGGVKVPHHVTLEEEFFQWFQLSHDFKVNKRFVKVDQEQYIVKQQQQMIINKNKQALANDKKNT